jgi:hypothetical protein
MGTLKTNRGLVAGARQPKESPDHADREMGLVASLMPMLAQSVGVFAPRANGPIVLSRASRAIPKPPASGRAAGSTPCRASEQNFVSAAPERNASNLASLATRQQSRFCAAAGGAHSAFASALSTRSMAEGPRLTFPVSYPCIANRINLCFRSELCVIKA